MIPWVSTCGRLTIVYVTSNAVITFVQGHGGRSGIPLHPQGHMPRNAPPHAHTGWMNRPGGGGRPSDLPQSQGMNDVFVTDNGFRPSGPRFDEFGSGGMPADRPGFGSRYFK